MRLSGTVTSQVLQFCDYISGVYIHVVAINSYPCHVLMLHDLMGTRAARGVCGMQFSGACISSKHANESLKGMNPYHTQFSWVVRSVLVGPVRTASKLPAAGAISLYLQMSMLWRIECHERVSVH